MRKSGPPILTLTADRRPVDLAGLYRRSCAFLVCGGPSFTSTMRDDLVLAPNALTMTVNGHGLGLRPDLWCCTDPPINFPSWLFADPRVLKFLPMVRADDPLADSMETPRTSPGCLFYKLGFRAAEPDNFFNDEFCEWGEFPDMDSPGVRSVMLPAIRILHWLGVATIFMLGADFPAEGSSTDPAYYLKLSAKFENLRPAFEEQGLQVLNCNPESGLTVFPFIDFREALDQAAGHWSEEPVYGDASPP